MSNKNPSRWSMRILIAVIAFAGMSMAFYMGLFQIGLIDSVWDPIFGKESEYVLTSNVALWIQHYFFIPDAILGGLTYLGDLIFALLFSDQRWKKDPWVVMLFGINIYPVGAVSLLLIAMQAFVVKEWCFLCILSASLSVVLMFLAYGEIYASYKYLKAIWKKHKCHKTLWQTFLGKTHPLLCIPLLLCMIPAPNSSEEEKPEEEMSYNFCDKLYGNIPHNQNPANEPLQDLPTQSVNKRHNSHFSRRLIPNDPSHTAEIAPEGFIFEIYK